MGKSTHKKHYGSIRVWFCVVLNATIKEMKWRMRFHFRFKIICIAFEIITKRMFMILYMTKMRKEITFVCPFLIVFYHLISLHLIYLIIYWECNHFNDWLMALASNWNTLNATDVSLFIICNLCFVLAHISIQTPRHIHTNSTLHSRATNNDLNLFGFFFLSFLHSNRS